MKATLDRQTTLHIWALGTSAVLLSVGSAFSYLLHIGQGIVIGDLIGLPGREAEVALAQHRYAYWLMACLFCLTGSIVTMALALPFCANASRWARLIARFILASIFSLALTVLIGVVSLTIIAALHHSVVR